MREITAYQTSDGKLFTDDRKAKSHQEDIIGELLDSLLPHDKRGNITRIDRHGLLMEMLRDDNLKKIIGDLHNTLSFSTEDNT